MMIGFRRRRRRPAGLHVCPICSADYVVPVWWEPLDELRWEMLLRCGGCETFREVIVPNEHADAFDRELERGLAAIEAALQRLELAAP